MARVPREPPQEPPSSSPLVPTGLQRYPGWRGFPLLRRLGSHVPPPLLFVALLPWLCLLSWQGHFSSSAPPRGCPPHSCSHPHRPQSQLDLCPCAPAQAPVCPAPAGLPVHLQMAWPGLAHFTLCLLSAVTTGFLGDYQNPDKEGQSCTGWTERPLVSHVSLGTSANVSSPEASASAPLVTHPPASRHLTPFILHPSGSMVGLGHPAPPHLHSGSKHGPGRSILKSQPQLVGQPCCLACVYLL